MKHSEPVLEKTEKVGEEKKHTNIMVFQAHIYEIYIVRSAHLHKSLELLLTSIRNPGRGVQRDRERGSDEEGQRHRERKR